MKAVFKTDRGKIRQHNEDNGGIYENASGQRLAIVADGMGGHRAGDVASQMASENIGGRWEKSPDIQTAEQAEEWLKTTIEEVNTLLYEHATRESECEGMGTTVVAAVCTDRFATIVNVGDSRGYILNETGFQQLTDDHSLVNELVRQGEISKEDAEHHPMKNVVLRALGTESTIKMDIMTIMFEEGDKLFLCSDGLSNKVTEMEMKETLLQDVSFEEQARQLIDLANQYGGEDNITLVIIEFDDKAGRG